MAHRCRTRPDRLRRGRGRKQFYPCYRHIERCTGASASADTNADTNAGTNADADADTDADADADASAANRDADREQL